MQRQQMRIIGRQENTIAKNRHAAVDAAPADPEEIALRTAARRGYKQVVEGEW